MARDDEQQKLRRSNDTLVNNQIESVKQATEIKIKKSEDTIRKLKQGGSTEEDPIVRLHRGIIRNVRDHMDQKIRELEQKRTVLVTFNLIAGGVVEIEES